VTGGPRVATENDSPAAAGLPLRALRQAASLLPRGRGRLARALSGALHEPFVDVVEPSDLGVRLAIDPRDPYQLEIWLGAYQPHVVSFLRKCVHPGDTVLTAGLHIGFVAAVAAALAGPRGRVFSAEPDPNARARAERNLALRGVQSAPIAIFAGGLSDRDGELRLFASAVLGHSSFAAPHHPDREIVARTRRGDDWLAERGATRLDVVVLDVEGWEMHVLRGLEQTISRSPGLRALVEVSDWALRDAGSSSEELIAFFESRGFEVRWASEHGDGLRHGVWGARATGGRGAPALDILCLGPGTAQ
jgi:FkbM family methyltransferase